MKIAKRDLALIMVIVGIIAAFCSYKFYFSGVLDSVDEEKTKQAGLEQQIASLEQQKKQVEQYEKDDNEMAQKISKLVKKYDPAYLYEDGIMWMQKIEDTIDGTAIASYTVGESGLNSIITGQGVFDKKVYVAGDTLYTYTYEVADYASLKEFIKYIVSGQDGVKNLQSMTFTQKEDSFTGSVTMGVFALSDETGVYSPQDLSGVQTGIEMIFPKYVPEKDDTKNPDKNEE